MPNHGTEEEYEFIAQVTVKVKLSVRTEDTTPAERKSLAAKIANNYLKGKRGLDTGLAFEPVSHAYGVDLSESEKPVFSKLLINGQA